MGKSQGLSDHSQGPGIDFDRVMLHPPRLGVYLPVLLLGLGDGLSRPVEKDTAGAGRALVDGGDIFHRWFLLEVVFSTQASSLYLIDEPYNFQTHGLRRPGHHAVCRGQDFGSDFPGQGQVQRIQGRQ